MIDVVIDISHHNKTPDFHAAYAHGLRGVIHKATEGLSYVDPCYKKRVQPIRSAGLMHGAYHFGTQGNGIAQARHFLEVVQPDDRTLIVLDWEPNPSGGTMSVSQARDFTSEIFAKTGRYPVLYTGSLAKDLLGKTKDPYLGRCPLWLAQYGPHTVVPATWSASGWTLWQYTDKGAIEGNPGTADRNRFNGDLSALRQLWGYPPLSP